MKKLLNVFCDKKSANIPTVGFIDRSELEINIPITNILEENKDFIWKCALNFSKLKFEKINFRNHGDEKYLNIDEDTKLFFSFFVPCSYANTQEWWKYVSSTHICLVYKDKPIINLKCTKPQGQEQIMIEYSDVILPFIDERKNNWIIDTNLENVSRKWVCDNVQEHTNVIKDYSGYFGGTNDYDKNEFALKPVICFFRISQFKPKHIKASVLTFADENESPEDVVDRITKNNELKTREWDF